METPNEDTLAWFNAFIPDDPRVRPGKMFGHACAFVGGNMFFGTFAQTLIVRVGEREAVALASLELPPFEPMAGRPWKDYLQVARGVVDDKTLRDLVERALDHTAGLPPKPVKAPKATKAPKTPKAKSGK